MSDELKAAAELHSYRVIVVCTREYGDRRIWNTDTYSNVKGNSEHEVRRNLIEIYRRTRKRVKRITVKKVT